MMDILHSTTGSNIMNQDPNLTPRSGRSLTDFSIILDLDATLISTMNYEEPGELASKGHRGIKNHLGVENSYVFDIQDDRGVETVYGVIRPHAVRFLEFCDRYFDKVIVYTAGTYEYGHGMVSEIFSRTHNRYAPDFILTRRECLYLDDPSFPLKSVRKPLELVIPGYDPRKYVLIDDRMSNIRFNPRNGIIIPPFNPTTKEEALSDTCLRELNEWFNQSKIVLLDDIRDAEKMMIFNEEYDLEKDFF